jgi:hypothetical protein
MLLGWLLPQANAIDKAVVAPYFNRFTFAKGVSRHQDCRQVIRTLRKHDQGRSPPTRKCPDFVRKHDLSLSLLDFEEYFQEVGQRRSDAFSRQSS